MCFLRVLVSIVRLMALISAMDEGLRFAIREGGRTDDAGVGSNQ